MWGLRRLCAHYIYWFKGLLTTLCATYSWPLLVVLTSRFSYVSLHTSSLLRWQGDYGGQCGKWFPATFCEEINIANGVKQTPDAPENVFEYDVSLLVLSVQSIRGLFSECVSCTIFMGNITHCYHYHFAEWSLDNKHEVTLNYLNIQQGKTLSCYKPKIVFEWDCNTLINQKCKQSQMNLRVTELRRPPNRAYPVLRTLLFISMRILAWSSCKIDK